MYEYRCKIVKIIDGDTVDVDIDLGFGVWMHKERIRLYGIDTPELRNHEQKIKAMESKRRLVELLNQTQNIVNVECGQFDKFGRVLVTLFTEKQEKSLNSLMIFAYLSIFLIYTIFYFIFIFFREIIFFIDNLNNYEKIKYLLVLCKVIQFDRQRYWKQDTIHCGKI